MVILYLNIQNHNLSFSQLGFNYVQLENKMLIPDCQLVCQMCCTFINATHGARYSYAHINSAIKYIGVKTVGICITSVTKLF